MSAAGLPGRRSQRPVEPPADPARARPQQTKRPHPARAESFAYSPMRGPTCQSSPKLHGPGRAARSADARHDPRRRRHLGQHASADSSLTREVHRTFSAPKEVILENLAGQVAIGRSKDKQVEVTAVIHAAGATASEAEALLKTLDFTFETVGDRLLVRGVYPTDRYQVYRYPPIDPDGHSTSQSTYDNQRIMVTSKDERVR